MSKRGIFKRTIAGISSAVMLLSVLQTPLTVFAAVDDVEIEVTPVDNSDTAYWLQYLYDTVNYPQFAIAEGLSVTIQTSENGKTTQLYKDTNLPDVESIFDGNEIYWLDVLRGVSSVQEFQQSYIALKKYVNEIAGSANSTEFTDSDFGTFMSMKSEISELDLTAIPVVSDSAELYSYYNTYIRYMYEADMLLLSLDFYDLITDLTPYYNTYCSSVTGNMPKDYKNSFKVYTGTTASGKTKTNLTTLFSNTDKDGLAGYFYSLNDLQNYLTKYAGISKDMSFEDYKAIIDKMENTDGVFQRTEDSAYAFEALCNLLYFAYDVTGADEAFSNDKEFAELYKYYKVAKLLSNTMTSKISDFYQTLVNDSTINIASYIACTNYSDFRAVIDSINSFNINTVINQWNNLKNTSDLTDSTNYIPTSNFYEITPFFNLGITSWDNSSIDYYLYSSDYSRGTITTDPTTTAYNVYTKIAKLTYSFKVQAANGGSANYFQKLLNDVGVTDATFSLSKNAKTSSGTATVSPRIRIVMQDANGVTSTYLASADDQDIGTLYTSLTGGTTSQYAKQNWARILKTDVITNTYSDELDSYRQSTQSTLESYKLSSNANNYENMAITALQKDYNLTGNVKYLIEIIHEVTGTGTLEKEEDDDDNSGDFDYGDPSGDDSGEITPSNPKGLSADENAITPYIPEYSLSEYYNGIAEIPATSSLNLSKVDTQSRGYITSYLSTIKTETTSSSGTSTYKPSTVELKVDITPLWKTVMSSVTTNKTYTKGWKTATTKYNTYDLNEYTGSHDIDINTDTSKRVVNSATFDTPTVQTSGLTSTTDKSSHLYAVAAQAYGTMNQNGTPYYKAVQRLLYPIEQYTNDGSSDKDLNKMSSINGGTRVSSDKSYQVYVTNNSVPDLTWNFTDTGSIINQNAENKNKTFQLDYYMWVSRTSEKDGVYIADWVNATPVLLNGLIGDTGASTGSVTGGTDGTSTYQPYTDSYGDYEVDNYDLALNSASVDADFSDWTISKKVVKSEYVWCDEHQVLIPKDKIDDHRYIWYEVKGEGKEWNAVSEEYEETFTYEWDAPSWQTDLTVLTRDSSTFTFNASEFYVNSTQLSGSEYTESTSDERVDENGTIWDDDVTLVGTDGSTYSAHTRDERENADKDSEGNGQKNRNKLFHDWYNLVTGEGGIYNYKGKTTGGGLYKAGSITQNTGNKTYQWECGFKTSGLWNDLSNNTGYSNGMTTVETVVDAIKRMGYTDEDQAKGVDWVRLMQDYDTYDTGYFNFTIVYAYSAPNAINAQGLDGKIYFCLEAKLKPKTTPTPLGDVEVQENPPEKTGKCGHTPATELCEHTEYYYDYDDEGNLIKVPYTVTSSYQTYNLSCEFVTEGGEPITEQNLDYEDPEDAPDDYVNPKNVITYWHAKVEEGTDIEYDGESPQSVQVCDDDFDDVFVYFLMTDYGTSLGGSNYEEPIITYDDNHEGSESNPLTDTIKATAMYDDGEGNETSEPKAVSDSHPESVIKDAAAELKQATLDAMEIEPCKCELSIPKCSYGTHSGTNCKSCNHSFTQVTDEEHFYPDEVENPENNYTSEEECLKGREFIRWAITNMSGNELDEEGIKAEVLKKTDPSKWVTFDNADKVSGLLLATDGSNTYREVPTLADGGTIKSNTNAGVIDGDNDEDLTGTDYTGHVTNAPYTYKISVIRKVITGKTGESNVYPASLTYTIDEVATANIADEDIFGVKLKDGTWQSDHLVSGYTYSIVPEVLMTYKTGVVSSSAATAFPDGALPDEAQRGVIDSVYVAGYNKYSFDFPMYNKIVLDAAGTTADTVSATTATATAAATLAKANNGTGNSGNMETPDVYYSGSEINTTTTLKSASGSAATATFTTYILDFDSANQNVKKAWNSGSTENDALNAANSWLKTYMNSSNQFEMTATTYITFGASAEYKAYSGSSTSEEGVAETYVGGGNIKVGTLSSTETLTFGTTGETQYTNTTGEYDIVIRNGRLYSITVDGTEYNLYGSEGYATSDELKAAFLGNGGASSTTAQLYKAHPDIAEAIINMQLAEFAATMDHNKGTETWNQYDGTVLFRETDTSGGSSGATLWSKIQAIKQTNQKVSDYWYAEDSTVLTIKQYDLSVDLPTAVVATFKLPIDYGYTSATSKTDQFANGTAVHAFAEFSLQLTTSDTDGSLVTYENGGTHASTSGINKKSYQHKNYSYVSWDIIGDELTGAVINSSDATFNRTPKQQFILSNVTVNDMYN